MFEAEPLQILSEEGVAVAMGFGVTVKTTLVALPVQELAVPVTE
jgi:hypothetical protein